MAIKFMGASVSSFNTNISFGLQPSDMTITLAEDLKDGDKFSPPPVGEPTVFAVGDFVFGGFLQSWTERTGTDGHLFEVKIVDPREFLSGINLILKGYTGHTGGIHNLFNLYGYHLNRDPSVLNDAGMLWGDVVSGFDALTQGVLRYRQYRFNINMSGLPSLPYYYRISGDNISLLDFIGDVCDAGGLDFYVDFDGNNINIVTFHRQSQPQPGLIKQFVDSIDGANAKEVGQELRLDTVNTFLLGGRVRQFHFQYSSFYTKEVAGGEITIPTYNVDSNYRVLFSGTPDQAAKVRKRLIEGGMNPARLVQETENGACVLYEVSYSTSENPSVVDKPSSIGISSDNNIWPYWGEDEYGNLIIGQGYNDTHSFAMNISDLGITYNGELKTKYPTDVAEIRAAGESRESWEAFLGLMSTHKYEMVPHGRRTGYIWDVVTNIDPLTEKIYLAKGAGDGQHPLSGLMTNLKLRPVISDTIKQGWVRFQRDSYKDPAKPELGYKDGRTEAELIDLYYNANISHLDERGIYDTYQHNGTFNIHFGKVFMLELHWVMSTKIVAKMLDIAEPIDAKQLGRLGYDPTTDRRFPDIEKMVERLHNRLGEMYNGYYGKKFIVRIPFSVNRLEGDITRINTTLVPTDSAPMDASVAESAVQQNLLPALYNKFITDDGKIEAYVRADLFLKKVTDKEEKEWADNVDEYKYAELDSSALNPEDYSYSTDGGSVFVRCSVDSEVRFYNKELLYNPRAVIELPGQLFYKDTDLLNSGNKGQVAKTINDLIAVRIANGEEVAVNANDILKGFGTDVLLKGSTKLFAYPVMAAVPLESQVNRYGPFYNLNMPGKVEVVIDEDLTPWSYGSYSNMSGAAYAKIIDSLSGQYASETGTVTVPGFPAISPGRPIVLGGPNVTNISCAVSEGGILTTYRMSTWTNRLGKLANQYVDAIQRQITDMNKMRALMSKNFKNNTGRLKRGNFKISHKPDRPSREKGQSTHAVLGAEFKGGRYEVFSLPSYHFNQQVGESDYMNQAFMSLDGFFVPVSFGSGTTVSGMPNYPYLTGSGHESPNANNLNPYYNGDVEGIGLIAVGEDPESSEAINTIGMDVRGLALKAPIVLAGWGYDIDDRPVPSMINPNFGTSDVNGSGTSRYTFASGYKTDTDQWKVGPLDVRWDDDRKVWAAGGGARAKLIVVRKPSGISYNETIDYIHTGSGLPTSGNVWNLGANNYYEAYAYNDDDDIYYVKNIAASIAPPRRFLAWNIDGTYYIDNQVSFVV